MPNESAGSATSSSSLFAAMKWLGGGLGLTGAFYACGFVIETTYQALLGVEIIDPANRIYLRSAANFWLSISNTLLALPNSAAALSGASGVQGAAGLAPRVPSSKMAMAGKAMAVLLLLGLLAIAAIMLRRYLKAHPAGGAPRTYPKSLLTLVVFGLSILSIAYFDVPLGHMTKILVRATEPHSHAHARNQSLLKGHIDNFEHLFWCAHRHGGSDDCSPADSQEAARTRLDLQFLLHFVVTSGIVLACLSLSRRGTGIALNLVLGADVLILSVGLLAFYAVAERSFEESKKVVVFYQKEDWLNGFLLDENDKKLTLLPASEPVPIEIPAAKAGAIKIVEQVPVLEVPNRDRKGVMVKAFRIDDDPESGIVTAFDLESRSVFKEASSDWSGKEVGKVKNVAVEYSGPITSQPLYGFALVETDAHLYLYETTSLEIWELVKARITLVEVEEMSDVLQYAPSAGATATSPAPPPPS
jgi:hypothetical protein